MTKIKFFVELDHIPSTTAQQKGYNRYTGQFYTKKRVEEQEADNESNDPEH